MFRPNEGWTDRALRVALGVILLYLGWAGVVGGTAGGVLKVLGFIPLVTGMVGWCPVYRLLGIDTRGKHRAHPAG